MNRIVIAASTVAVFLLSGSFILAERTADDLRNLDSFNGIGISIHAEVYYNQGNTHEIKIEGNERDVKDLITKVENGFLQVKYDDWKIKRSKLIIHITSKELEKVKLSGSANFLANKEVSSDEMEIAVSGSGKVIFSKLQSDEVDTKISGSGGVELAGGSADEVDVKISGSGKLQAEGFNVSEYSVALSGSGNVRINVTDELDAKISGSGKVYYRGNPQVNSVTSGSGKIVAL